VYLHEELPENVEQRLSQADLKDLPTGKQIDTEKRRKVSSQLHKQGKILHIPWEDIWVFGREKTADSSGDRFDYVAIDTENGEVQELAIREFNLWARSPLPRERSEQGSGSESPVIHKKDVEKIIIWNRLSRQR